MPVPGSQLSDPCTSLVRRKSPELLHGNDLGGSRGVIHSLAHHPRHAPQVAVHLRQRLPVADDPPHLPSSTACQMPLAGGSGSELLPGCGCKDNHCVVSPQLAQAGIEVHSPADAARVAAMRQMNNLQGEQSLRQQACAMHALHRQCVQKCLQHQHGDESRGPCLCALDPWQS